MRNKNRWAILITVIILSSLSIDTTLAEEHIWKAADGVYRYGPGDGYYSMFVVTDSDVIAIEPVNTEHSKGFLQAIKSVTDRPVKYLLHSHNHWDHSGGGQVFRDAGATIIAHTEAYEWMKANPHPDMALPDEAWSGNKKEIISGGKTIELHYMGMSHGLGMTVFRLPEEKIIYVADLVAPDTILFTIVPDFNIKEFIRTLKDIEKMDFQKAIFSHSASKEPFGSKLNITQTREYIEDLQAAIVTEFKKGTSMFAIPNVVKLPKYEDWSMYNEFLPMNAWRVMLDMHMGPFPWRPDSSAAAK